MYKGILNGSAVAVKRLRIEANAGNGQASSQGTAEFLQEMAVAIRVRSPFTLPLLGVVSSPALHRRFLLSEASFLSAEASHAPPEWISSGIDLRVTVPTHLFRVSWPLL